MKRTPLYERHLHAGAKMVSFAGWEMPIQYHSILNEHLNVRKNGGIFDVSHMTKLVIKGSSALSFLEKLTCNTVSKIQIGQVQYNLFINEDGGVVDDITIYRVMDDEFFVVVNAANHSNVLNYLENNSKILNLEGNGLKIMDQSELWQQIAVQGPQAQKVLEEVLGYSLEKIAYFYFTDINNNANPFPLRISRTGYTGEDGFEVYASSEAIILLWDELVKKGESNHIQPAGLGARDGLRLEAFYPLYGNELNEAWTPVESGMGWAAKKKDPPYLGYTRIMQQKIDGPPGKVMGFRLNENGMARKGYTIFDESGEKKIAQVLSAAYSPLLKCCIGTAYLPDEFQAKKIIHVEVRKQLISADLHRGAFVEIKAGKTLT